MNPLVLEGVSVVLPEKDGLHSGIATIKTILEDIELHIGPGEWIGIAGRNGSGKSTLGAVIAGLCAVTSGNYRKGWTEDGKIGMVLQNPDIQIVGETVLEDVCFGMEVASVDPKLMLAKADYVLKRVGLNDMQHVPVVHLSGGQKQLLAIAGCLAVDCRMIVFDEATAMLDPAARRRIWQMAESLQREGTAVVWITQWMDELAGCENVIALDQGQIIYHGDPIGFFYGQSGEAISPCDRLGFPAPYAVQLGREFIAQDIPLAYLPLNPEELVGAVKINDNPSK